MIAIETTDFCCTSQFFSFLETNFPLSQIPGIPPRKGSRLTQGVSRKLSCVVSTLLFLPAFPELHPVRLYRYPNDRNAKLAILMMLLNTPLTWSFQHVTNFVAHRFLIVGI